MANEAIQMAVKNDQQPMMISIEGKITAQRFQHPNYYTTIVCRAPDEFSAPPVVEVRSVGQLGPDNTVVKVNCKLGGFLGRPYEVVDRNTGAKRQVRSCILTLDQVQ